MKQIVILLILVVISCKEMVIKKSREEKSLIHTKWERLTINKNDSVIYRPCDADNASIKFLDNKIFINYGQEELVYNILKKIDRDTEVSYNLSPNLDFNYFVISKELLKVKINGNEYIYTTYKNQKYKVVEQLMSDCTQEDDIYENNEKKLNKLITKWQGIYYYDPFDSKDSIGSYYIDIDENKTNYGYSGGDGHFLYRSLDLIQNKDTLYIKNSSSILAKLYKKNNQFLVESNLIRDRKSKNNNTSGIFAFKYAKSASEVQDDKE